MFVSSSLGRRFAVFVFESIFYRFDRLGNRLVIIFLIQLADVIRVGVAELARNLGEGDALSFDHRFYVRELKLVDKSHNRAPLELFENGAQILRSYLQVGGDILLHY